MGTLLELGNCSLDVLRQLVNRPAEQMIAPASSASDLGLDVRESMRVVRRNLETVLLYAVTQLAMWLAKSEVEAGSGDMDDDVSMRAETPPAPADSHSLKVKRRTSMPLAERLRRGMTGEMAADLLGLLNKAKPLMAKSAETLGEGTVDLTPILARFVQERISS